MESKRCRIRRVKNWRIALATLTSLVFRGLATLSVVFLGLPNVAIAREIQGQVVIVTKDGKSVKLVSVEVFAYNRSDVEKAIKQVDEKLKARREKVRSGNDIDNLVKKASDARKEAHEKELQHPEDESLRLASEQASNLEKDVLEFVALARRRRNYLLSSQPYFAALPYYQAPAEPSLPYFRQRNRAQCWSSYSA